MFFVYLIGFLTFLSIASCKFHVSFYFSNRVQNRTKLSSNNLETINVEKPTFLLLHGWMEDSNIPYIIELTSALLEQDDYNVIAVDYKEISYLVYAHAVKHIPIAGKAIAALIHELYEKYNASLNNFHLIGHSLGAQVSGFAGKIFKNLTDLNIGRITALDPAGPLFCSSAPKNRLAGTDADIVITLHTDGMGSGYYCYVGGIDIYPNGGTAPQPGCLFSHIVGCSHIRSIKYYLEALRNPYGFLATRCENYIKYLLGICKYNSKITLGGNFTRSDPGKYYCTTNSESPFSED